VLIVAAGRRAFAMFLIIDDEIEIRETLTEIFKIYGYFGRTAENGRSALEALRSRCIFQN
jgi:DNA-binding NtrC family response regulator